MQAVRAGHLMDGKHPLAFPALLPLSSALISKGCLFSSSGQQNPLTELVCVCWGRGGSSRTIPLRPAYSCFTPP